MIFSVIVLAICFYAPLSNWLKKERKKNYVFQKKEDSVFVAESKNGKEIYLTPQERTQHIHVIGTTGVGKTEFSLNMMFQDIEQRRGFLLIEHKSDHDLLDQIYAKVKKEGREKDFHLFSLIHPEESSKYNPLIGGHPEEICERVFQSFDVSHEFYKNVQFQWLSHVIMLLSELGEIITFEKLFECISNDQKLKYYLKRYESKKDTPLWQSINSFLKSEASARNENLKGLEVYLSRFATGRLAPLLNTQCPKISLPDALEKGQIVYFQLPTMKYHETAVSIGKLALHDFQSAVSTRQIERKTGNFFSCYLDEFSSIVYPGFTELISKARSANVGLVLSHTALGDLTKISESFSETVLTNTNTKVVFRCPDPKTAEYFGKALGTRHSIYQTEQTKAQLVGDPRTGMGTNREVEEFILHPDRIKKFSVGCGAIAIPTKTGVKIEECYFPKINRLIPLTGTKKKEELKNESNKNIKNLIYKPTVE